MATDKPTSESVERAYREGLRMGSSVAGDVIAEPTATAAWRESEARAALAPATSREDNEVTPLAALCSAVRRLETIQETHPEIVLSADLASYRETIVGARTCLMCGAKPSFQCSVNCPEYDTSSAWETSNPDEEGKL